MTDLIIAVQADLTLLTLHTRLAVLVTTDSMQQHHLAAAIRCEQSILARAETIQTELDRLYTLEEAYWRDALDEGWARRLAVLTENESEPDILPA